MTNLPLEGELFPGGCRLIGDGPGAAVLPCCRSAAAILPLGKKFRLASVPAARCSRHWGTHPPGPGEASQGQLFATGRPGNGPDPAALAAHFTRWPYPQSLQFWRWPTARSERGGASMLVIDQPPHLNNPFAAVHRRNLRGPHLRWKGDHDCKTYRRPTRGPCSRPKTQERLASIRFLGGTCRSGKGAPVPLSRPRSAAAAPGQQGKRANAWADRPSTSDLG